MPIRILFVDDEPNILSGLKRMLRPFADLWEMEFATSGPEALKRLEAQTYDVIVSDMRMPGMDGAQLLDKVRETYPNIVRIILSGHSEQEVILKAIGPTHQYLAKPCDPEVLRETIKRSVALSSLLMEPRLKNVAGGMNRLPSIPKLFRELVDELQSPQASLQKVGKIISQDPGMTAQILRLVNSAYFGLSKNITNPTLAVTMLGISTVTALVLSIHVFQQADQKQHGQLGLEALWRHSLATAAYSRSITQVFSDSKQDQDDSFTAGLVHDVGQIVLGMNFPDKYQIVLEEARKRHEPLTDVENDIIGASHAEMGAYLMGVWGLPNPIVEALAFHHSPHECIDLSIGPLVAVHLADVFDSRFSSYMPGGSLFQLDKPYLKELGIWDRVGELEERCRTVSGMETLIG